MPIQEYVWDAPAVAPLFIIEETSSTFDAAWSLAEERVLPSWASLLAFSQTSGRGQLRRFWHSPPGNLYVSFFLPEDIARAGDLAAPAIAWCVCASLAGEGVNVRLKWPNDILLTLPDGTEGKFGGLLLEERRGRVLAGLGLNLKTAPDETLLRAGRAVPAVALPACPDEPHIFWARLLPRLAAVYREAVAPAGRHELRKIIETRLAWIGRIVHAEEAGLDGRILGMDDDGSLRLQHGGGECFSVSSGSIYPV